MGNATIPINRCDATSKAGFVRWAILVIHLFSGKGSKNLRFLALTVVSIVGIKALHHDASKLVSSIKVPITRGELAL
jgi:hypothetical protein